MKTEMRKIYVCHPYSGDPVGNTEKVRKIAEQIALLGAFPLAPHLYFPQFISEEENRELAMRLCVEWMLDDADEVWVYGPVISAGMRIEIDSAVAAEMKIRNYTSPTLALR